MDKAQVVIAEARDWIGTPVRHLGRSKGIEVDCVGLIMLVGLACDVTPDPRVDGVEPWRPYGRLPNPVRMRRFAETLLVPVKGEHRPADVALLAWGDHRLPMHLAIMSTFAGRETMIHSHGAADPPRVLETTWGGDWPQRCHGFFRYPGLV